jgi:N-acetylglucosamine transport system permease protein
LLLGFHAIAVILPMLWLIASSFKNSWGIFQNPWAMPDKLRWVNYANAWRVGNLGWKFVNSIMVSFSSLALALILGSMVAYVVGRFFFPARRLVYFSFVGGMALPAFLGIVPLFLLMQNLHLYGTRYGLIAVYVTYSLPFSVFVLTGFFRTLPHELAEAASMDGASPFLTFWRIMLPLAKPGLITAGTFVFISLWNEYPIALVLLGNNEATHTLPLGIANLAMTQKYQADWGALFAALAIGILPTVLLYTVFQRQIQGGLTAGAIKG